MIGSGSEDCEVVVQAKDWFSWVVEDNSVVKQICHVSVIPRVLFILHKLSMVGVCLNVTEVFCWFWL